ncbi:unnamed protein product [Prorocentrum cordatum]|uniref:Reverse transcriptase domain-containing protein n=1 Tax=Prorocentrum cordatum TaxID=2364126 RepID=A0ABN9T045_9DINO|nr:unnamed protein product [Polarella glacialis]
MDHAQDLSSLEDARASLNATARRLANAEAAEERLNGTVKELMRQHDRDTAQESPRGRGAQILADANASTAQQQALAKDKEQQAKALRKDPLPIWRMRECGATLGMVEKTSEDEECLDVAQTSLLVHRFCLASAINMAGQDVHECKSPGRGDGAPGRHTDSYDEVHGREHVDIIIVWAASVAPDGAFMVNALQRLKDKAVELTKNEVLNDMRKLQNEASGSDDDEHRRRTQQNSINQRLARLTRGTANAGIYLLETDEGDVATDTRTIAEHLAAHWAKVLRGKPADEARLNSWLALAERVGSQRLEENRYFYQLALDRYRSLALTIASAGFPALAMEVLIYLCHMTIGTLLLHGQLHGEVPLETGIRQGCPLSPLFFALASDSLLRILGYRSPTSTTRAFADDTAMLVRSWRTEHRQISNTFRTFEAVSNLALILSKTLVIPLWEADIEQLQESTRSDQAAIQIKWGTTGKYLGYYVGPGKQYNSWDKPLDKYTSRLGDWRWSELGLNMALVAYNAYVLPTILFIAQLEAPPQEVIDRERVAVRRVAPGPGFWRSSADLRHGLDIGLAAHLRPLEISCRASMLRMHAWESRQDGGIDWKGMAAELVAARGRADRVMRVARFFAWLDRHIPTTVLAESDRQARSGAHIHAARPALGGVAMGPLTEQKDRQFRKGAQRWFTGRLLARDGYCVERRLWARLARWSLPELPGRAAQRAAQHLRRLRHFVPPRIRAAMINTIFNRWATNRRMRSLREGRRVCVLGCSCTADDSVEHYMRCPVGQTWSRRRLGWALTQTEQPWTQRMLASVMTDKQLQQQAVTNYTLYRAVNDMRRRQIQPSAERRETANAIMDQLLHEATTALGTDDVVNDTFNDRFPALEHETPLQIFDRPQTAACSISAAGSQAKTSDFNMLFFPN